MRGSGRGQVGSRSQQGQRGVRGTEAGRMWGWTRVAAESVEGGLDRGVSKVVSELLSLLRRRRRPASYLSPAGRSQVDLYGRRTCRVKSGRGRKRRRWHARGRHRKRRRGFRFYRDGGGSRRRSRRAAPAKYGRRRDRCESLLWRRWPVRVVLHRTILHALKFYKVSNSTKEQATVFLPFCCYLPISLTRARPRRRPPR